MDFGLNFAHISWFFHLFSYRMNLFRMLHVTIFLCILRILRLACCLGYCFENIARILNESYSPHCNAEYSKNGKIVFTSHSLKDQHFLIIVSLLSIFRIETASGLPGSDKTGKNPTHFQIINPEIQIRMNQIRFLANFSLILGIFDQSSTMTLTHST